MKKVTLIQSLKDLAAKRADALCDKSKPYYQTFVDGMEKKIVDDLIEDAIKQENVELVRPIISAYVKEGNITPIPVPFEIDGKVYTQIKKDRCSFDVSHDGEHWQYLTNENKIRLYEALEAAGCLDNIE